MLLCRGSNVVDRFARPTVHIRACVPHRAARHNSIPSCQRLGRWAAFTDSSNLGWCLQRVDSLAAKARACVHLSSSRGRYVVRAPSTWKAADITQRCGNIKINMKLLEVVIWTRTRRKFIRRYGYSISVFQLNFSLLGLNREGSVQATTMPIFTEQSDCAIMSTQVRNIENEWNMNEALESFVFLQPDFELLQEPGIFQSE